MAYIDKIHSSRSLQLPAQDSTVQKVIVIAGVLFLIIAFIVAYKLSRPSITSTKPETTSRNKPRFDPDRSLKDASKKAKEAREAAQKKAATKMRAQQYREEVKRIAQEKQKEAEAEQRAQILDEEAVKKALDENRKLKTLLKEQKTKLDEVVARFSEYDLETRDKNSKQYLASTIQANCPYLKAFLIEDQFPVEWFEPHPLQSALFIQHIQLRVKNNNRHAFSVSLPSKITKNYTQENDIVSLISDYLSYLSSGFFSERAIQNNLTKLNNALLADFVQSLIKLKHQTSGTSTSSSEIPRSQESIDRAKKLKTKILDANRRQLTIADERLKQAQEGNLEAVEHLVQTHCSKLVSCFPEEDNFTLSTDNKITIQLSFYLLREALVSNHDKLKKIEELHCKLESFSAEFKKYGLQINEAMRNFVSSNKKDVYINRLKQINKSIPDEFIEKWRDFYKTLKDEISTFKSMKESGKEKLPIQTAPPKIASCHDQQTNTKQGSSSDSRRPHIRDNSLRPQEGLTGNSIHRNDLEIQSLSRDTRAPILRKDQRRLDVQEREQERQYQAELQARQKQLAAERKALDETWKLVEEKPRIIGNLVQRHCPKLSMFLTNSQLDTNKCFDRFSYLTMKYADIYYKISEEELDRESAKIMNRPVPAQTFNVGDKQKAKDDLDFIKQSMEQFFNPLLEINNDFSHLDRENQAIEQLEQLNDRVPDDFAQKWAEIDTYEGAEVS